MTARARTLVTRALGYDHPDAAALVAGAQRVYVERYGGPDTSPVDPAEFAPPAGLFLVGYLDGVPVACGGWRLRAAHSELALRAGDAELKRMYVVASARGRGFARQLLAELEHTAAAAGARRIVLETGSRQPEAIALYESAGYQRIPTGFGIYRDEPGARYFAKPLTPPIRPCSF